VAQHWGQHSNSTVASVRFDAMVSRSRQCAMARPMILPLVPMVMADPASTLPTRYCRHPWVSAEDQRRCRSWRHSEAQFAVGTSREGGTGIEDKHGAGLPQRRDRPQDWPKLRC
jgi:hypothetical protein